MTQFSLKKGCLSGSTLKIIAIIAMAIDHFAASIILYGILMQQNPTFLGHPISMTMDSSTPPAKRNMPPACSSLPWCPNFPLITHCSTPHLLRVTRMSFSLYSWVS